MSIERVIGGVIYEFPNGTSEATIRKFEASKTGGAAAPTPSAPAQPPAARPRPFSTGLGSQALQGLTMGFSDEAIAKLRSAMGQGSYEDLVKAEREGLRKYREANPVSSTVAEMGGSLAPALVTGGGALIPGASRAVASRLGPRAAELLFGTKPTIGRAVGVGAGTGAVSAVGTSEKPMGELPGEALKGGIAGGTIAGGAGLAGQYVLMPAFRRVKTAMGYGDSNKAADLAIARALEKDGMTPDQAAARLAAMQRGEATLADLGENTAALLRRSSAAPGAARRDTKAALAAREIERVPRVSEDLRTLMSGSKDFYTDVTDLIRKRSEEADALYKAAWDSAPTFTPRNSRELEALRNLPTFRTAMEGGSRRMADQGLDINDPANVLRGLHETKLELDDMIERAMSSDRGANQARILMDMKEKLLKAMERRSPEYRTAREAFAGDSEMLTAMKEGQRIYQLPEMDMRKLIERFRDSPSEYDAFRAGVSQAMLERMRAGGPTADPLATIFPRGVEDKLRRAFRDDEAFDTFKNRLVEERNMLQTEKTGFRRSPLDTDLADDAGGVGAATALVQGRPFGAMLETVRNRFPALTGVPPSVAAPTVQKLLTPAAKTDAVIDSIMQSLKTQEQELLTATGAAGTAAGMAGALGASRGIPQQYPEESVATPGTPSGPPSPSPLQQFAR